MTDEELLSCARETGSRLLRRPIIDGNGYLPWCPRLLRLADTLTWKRNPSESEVLALAERIRMQPKNEWLYIDEEGKTVVGQGAWRTTPGFSRRQILIVGEVHFNVRPTVPEVLAVLKKELDEHEYD